MKNDQHINAALALAPWSIGDMVDLLPELQYNTRPKKTGTGHKIDQLPLFVAAPMSQFTLRDLFLMMTLIAVGVAGIVPGFQNAFAPCHGPADPVPYLLLYLGSCASLGTGIMVPFNKKVLGGIMGGLAGLAVLFPLFAG